MGNQLFDSFFDHMIHDLEERLVSEAKGRNLRLLEAAERTGILDGIRRILYRIGFRCLLLEYHVCDRSKKLSGENVEEKILFYQKQFLSDKEYCQSVFRIYPELDRMCRTAAEKQITFVLELFERLQKDKTEIENKLLQGKVFQRIEDIRVGKGDLHCGGGSVAALRLDIGGTVYYKPRSAASDIMFYEFADRMEGEGRGFGTLCRCLDCGRYGWAAGIEYRECSSERQRQKFYQRIGVMTGICFLLGSHDLHYQNLVACGEYPVLVDLENIFRTDEEEFLIGEDTMLKYSVLDSNLFPMSMRERGICAATGGSQEKGYYQVPMLHMDENDISVVYGKPDLEKGKNCPGKRINAADYRAEIIEGFEFAWDYISRMPDAAIKEVLSGEMISRCLMHSTQLYHSILEASFHPSLMMDPEERKAFIRRICPAGDMRHYEIEDLTEGDIPYFYRKAGNRSLFVSSGQEIRDYFDETVPEAVIRRKYGMNKKKKKLQCELLHMSMNLSGLDENALTNSVYSGEQEEGKEKEWIELAVEMADKIARDAIWNDDKTMVTWLTLQRLEEDEIDARINAIDYYLYNGLAGIAVFMRAMNLIYGGYDKICAAAETTLFTYTDHVLEGRRKVISDFTGAYCGEASVMYTYQILYGMTGEQRYLRYAARHAEIVVGLIGQDTRYDLLYGNAGAVCVFCNMYELTREDKYLEYAQQTEQLLRRCLWDCKEGMYYYQGQDEKNLCMGMAHGYSGFIMSYGRLSRWAESGSAYDEILGFLLDSVNANFIRQEEERNRTSQKTTELPSWCRGNLGILSAYLDLKRNTGTKFDSKTAVILEKAEQIIWEIPLRRSMSLCHGNLGNLIMAAGWAHETGGKAQESLRRFEGKVQKLLSHKGVMMETEGVNHGMMDGCAGIGWGCLGMCREEIWGMDVLAVRVSMWGI